VNSFTPSIVQGLGYTAEQAQLMSVPPFAVAFVGEWILHVILSPLISPFFLKSFHGRGLYFRPLWMPWFCGNVFLRIMCHRLLDVPW
jgi:hypothetical protein